MTDVMTDTITVATWEQATEGRRDTNPFDYIETELLEHVERVGLYDVVRSYSEQVADALPEHMDFVGNTFVVDASRAGDLDAARAAVVSAIQEADQRHREIVRTWLS